MQGQADPAVKPETTASQSRSSAPRVRLSCEACRQRKVKCDKLSPCTSCVRLGFVCVPVERARLPRGRTRKPTERAANTDKELVDRVAKLEQLLRRVAAERDDPAVETPASVGPIMAADTEPDFKSEHGFETNMAEVETWHDQYSQPSTGLTMTLPHRPRPTTSYIGSSFWEDIMQQVST